MHRLFRKSFQEFLDSPEVPLTTPSPVCGIPGSDRPRSARQGPRECSPGQEPRDPVHAAARAGGGKVQVLQSFKFFLKSSH